MHFDMFGHVATQTIRRSALSQLVGLHELATSATFHNPALSTQHVKSGFVVSLSLKVERRHDSRIGFVGAGPQRLQPSRGKLNVIFDEHEVLLTKMGHRKVLCLVRGKWLFDSQQLDSGFAFCLAPQGIADSWRRTGINDHDVPRGWGVVKQAPQACQALLISLSLGNNDLRNW
jgi:hypothetical protein